MEALKVFWNIFSVLLTISALNWPAIRICLLGAVYLFCLYGIYLGAKQDGHQWAYVGGLGLGFSILGAVFLMPSLVH